MKFYTNLHLYVLRNDTRVKISFSLIHIYITGLPRLPQMNAALHLNQHLAECKLHIRVCKLIVTTLIMCLPTTNHTAD